MPYFIGKKLP